MIPKNIKNLQSESRQLQVRRVNKNTLVVNSASNPVANYIVTVHFNNKGKVVHARCTCSWAQHRGVGCSHVMASLEYLAALKDRKLSFWGSREEALRQKQRLFFLQGDKDSGVWITSRGS
ncbi:MAG: hypothetical protein OHK0046_35770 [Anaerolineae bacterium]